MEYITYADYSNISGLISKDGVYLGMPDTTGSSHPTKSGRAKLTPLPEATKTLRAIYRTVFDAAKAVSAIMSQPVVPCALEFIDGNAINMIRQYSTSDLPEQAGAMLMIEVDGQKEGLDTAAEKVAASAKNEGLLDIRLAQSDAEVKALWQTRKALSPALRKVAPKKINEDVVVPVTEIPALIEGLDKLSKKYDLPIINFGHAGNGNIQPVICPNKQARC
jgi:D-lactate dehydrogenase